MNEKEILRQTVRRQYGQRAQEGGSCCGNAQACCGSSSSTSTRLGYSPQQLDSIPRGADLGLGCGNPTAMASLKPGEVALDLGAGAGIDCFLAAQLVGDSGHIIGVDMTAAMIDRARENAAKSGMSHVEFRLGEIEHLPVADGSVDAVISNCVINLSPDKPQVFREIFRTLKPGGRMMISDIVQLKPLPDFILKSVEAYVGCIAGASLKQDYVSMIEAAGFHNVEIVTETVFDAVDVSTDAKILLNGQEVTPEEFGLTPEMARNLAGSMASIGIRAFK